MFEELSEGKGTGENAQFNVAFGSSVLSTPRAGPQPAAARGISPPPDAYQVMPATRNG